MSGAYRHVLSAGKVLLTHVRLLLPARAAAYSLPGHLRSLHSLINSHKTPHTLRIGLGALDVRRQRAREEGADEGVEVCVVGACGGGDEGW